MAVNTVLVAGILAIAAMSWSGAATFPAVSPSASVATDEVAFVSFDAEYSLGRDDGGNATLRTVETIDVVFPQGDESTSIFRAIPTVFNGVGMGVQIESVTDAAGDPVDHRRTNDGDFAELRIGDGKTYVHGPQRFVVEYTQRHVVRSFEDTGADEFYWDVNGTGWDAPFGAVSARVHLGDGIGAETAGGIACYVGGQGSTGGCPIEREGDLISAEASDLAPFETMTIAVGFDQSTFVDAPQPRDHWVLVAIPVLLLASLAALAAFLLYLRLRVWTDAPGRGIIVAQYEPLDNVHPMLAAELLRRPRTALPAQIVAFAVDKVLRIREFPQRLTGKKTRYELQLLSKGHPGLSSPEKVILTTLFGKLTLNRVVRLDATSKVLGTRLARRRNDETYRVTQLRLREQTVSVWPARVQWAAFGLATAAVALLWLANYFEVASLLHWLTALVALAALLPLFVWAKPRDVLTEKGAAVRDHLLGMRLYIRLAEADRIRVLQAPDTAERVDVTDTSAVIKLYERMLPYAIIFGLEKQWMAELEVKYALEGATGAEGAPGWYAGTDDFSGVSVFAGTMAGTTFATQAAASSSSSSASGSSDWSSSGSSGSSGGSDGGGSAGDGGGGGGGGSD